MTSFTFDASGKLVPPTAQELAKSDEDSAILVYMTGTVDDGRPYYAYLAVKPSRYSEFQEMSAASQEVTPTEYGTIIASDFESSPTPEVMVMMRDTYGFDVHYLEKLRQGVITQHAVFLKNKEDERIGDIVSMLKKKQLNGG